MTASDIPPLNAALNGLATVFLVAGIIAIKANRKTLEPIEVGHRTISISQIGLIACQLQEKLVWNPEKEFFEGNNAANALLASPLARKEWAM